MSCMCEYSGYKCIDCENAAVFSRLAESQVKFVSDFGCFPNTIYITESQLGILAGRLNYEHGKLAGLRIEFSELPGTPFVGRPDLVKAENE